MQERRAWLLGPAFSMCELLRWWVHIGQFVDTPFRASRVLVLRGCARQPCADWVADDVFRKRPGVSIVSKNALEIALLPESLTRALTERAAGSLLRHFDEATQIGFFVASFDKKMDVVRHEA